MDDWGKLVKKEISNRQPIIEQTENRQTIRKIKITYLKYNRKIKWQSTHAKQKDRYKRMINGD
jgi:hypothetical protein